MILIPINQLFLVQLPLSAQRIACCERPAFFIFIRPMMAYTTFLINKLLNTFL